MAVSRRGGRGQLRRSELSTTRIELLDMATRSDQRRHVAQDRERHRQQVVAEATARSSA